MTPRLWAFAGLLLVLFASTIYLALHWPDDESDTTLRQEAADVIGLACGLLACLWWALTALPRMVLAANAARREVTR